MEKVAISSERFIELFITLKQLQILGNNKEPNLYNFLISFNTRLLSEFILFSKKDYRYKNFLTCFNFNGEYSLNLISALNRALGKHLLTGIYDDEAYITRYYTNYRVIEENIEYCTIIQEFIKSFDYYCLDKELYIKSTEAFINDELQEAGDNSRTIFDLQRRIIKEYEE